QIGVETQFAADDALRHGEGQMDQLAFGAAHDAESEGGDFVDGRGELTGRDLEVARGVGLRGTLAVGVPLVERLPLDALYVLGGQTRQLELSCLDLSGISHRDGLAARG